MVGTQHISPITPFSFPPLLYPSASNPCCVMLHTSEFKTPLTLVDHKLKTNGHPGRDKVKTTETKSPLGMLEWLQPLEALWKVEVIDWSKFLLKTRYLGCQVTERL